MKGITSAKLSRSIAVVGAAVEQHIDAATAQASKYRELLYLLRGLEAPVRAKSTRGGGDIEPPSVRAKGKRPQPGTIPDRVLDIMSELGGEAVTMPQILKAKHGAKDYQVKLAVRGLVHDGWLEATGSTTTRRYNLPVRRKGAA